MDEYDSLMVLNAVPSLSNKKIRSLLERFGSASVVLKYLQTATEAKDIESQKVLSQVNAFPINKFLDSEKKLLKTRQSFVLAYNDTDYPKILKEIPDAPVVLYVKGKKEAWGRHTIGMVGSRKASLYGTSVAGTFAARFAELGLTIVSGLARGIDTAAHKGALKVKGTTIAVLGSGLAESYPPENEGLIEQISASGAVISEFPMLALPIAFNFPRRNRIISGLSLGVIIVEAAQRSGALITADFALEQGREVYAVPGSIQTPAAQGVHRLIKQGAKLITCVEDVLEDLAPQLLNEREEHFLSERRDPEIIFSSQEKALMEILKKAPQHIDVLTESCGIGFGEAVTALTQLELKRAVKKLPGQFYSNIYNKN